MKRYVLAGILACFMTVMVGCASHIKPFGSEGYVDLHADEKGLLAWFDGTNGLIQSGKGSPNELDNHHKLRGKQLDVEKHGLTLRFGKQEASHE